MSKLKDWVYPEATEIDTTRDLKIVEAYLPKRKDAKILDAGGGTGRITIPLAKKGYKVTLLDISKTALKLAEAAAKKEGVDKSIKFVQGDVCDLGFFENNSFDLVLALRDVVNYAVDKKRAANELQRVLKPNCYLIVSSSNKVFWLTQTERWEYRFEKLEDLLKTESMFTEKELRALFKGLEIEKVVGSGYCSGNLPSKFLNKEWIELENKIGEDEELKLACEYLVLIGKKHG